MEIDYTVPALSQPAVPGIGAQTRDDPQRETSSSVTPERVSLPGSPRSIPNSLPEIPQLGLDWNEMDVIEAHYPAAERLRVQRVREVNLFSSEQILREYMKMHLMNLFPNQPDLFWDYPMFWSQRELHGYQVFREIVVDGKYQNSWGSFVEQWFVHIDAPIYHHDD